MQIQLNAKSIYRIKFDKTYKFKTLFAIFQFLNEYFTAERGGIRVT